MSQKGTGARTGGANLIGGEWRAAESGAFFEVREALAPFAVLGSWPVSEGEDAATAGGELARGLETWGKVGVEERRARLAQGARHLVRDDEAFASVARRVGLRAEELAADRRALCAFEPAALDALGDARIAWCASDWSELLSGTYRRAVRELRLGSALGLIADPRLPMAADAVARALVAAGVPSSGLCVLHGVTRASLERLLADRRVGSLSASGGRERVAELRASTSRAGTPRVELELLRSAALEIGTDEDVARAAATTIERAFGRATSLSGQRSGQVGRVFCPERLFSRFTQELLAQLEAHESAREPLPLVDRAAQEHVRSRWANGIDEGATLVFGGRERARESARTDLAVLPAVFTNVEPTMGIARRQEPAPVLCLIRSQLPLRARL